MTCINLGAVWICKRCWGIVRPPADEVSTKLMNSCTGHTSNGSKKFGLLLPKECRGCLFCATAAQASAGAACSSASHSAVQAQAFLW